MVSNFANANVTCDAHYSLSAEKKIQNIIEDEKISFNTKTDKIHQLMVQTLRDRKITYKTVNVDGLKLIVINPSKSSKLGRFARYLENNYQTKLAASFELTGKIDAGLNMNDQDILLTSIQDILRGDIGAATRHELSHLWESAMSEIDNPHPVFNTSIRSDSTLFDSKYMQGYESFITYGEVHAYSRELHYSLWKLRHTQDKQMQTALEIDINEAHNRLQEITSQLKSKTIDIRKNLKNYDVTKDDYTFYIKSSDFNMTIDRSMSKLDLQLEVIINHLNQLEQKLKSTQMKDLEAMLLKYLVSLK